MTKFLAVSALVLVSGCASTHYMQAMTVANGKVLMTAVEDPAFGSARQVLLVCEQTGVDLKCEKGSIEIADR